MTKWLIGIALFVLAVITVPQINYVARQLDLVYCEQRNEWVREILIKFIRIKAPDYPDGGICA